MGCRLVNFVNLPIKFLMPKTFTNITEISLKTIPSASKIEIKRVLESLYGFEVEKVQTLNMEGKKKTRGGLLIARADYKKAYVTLKNPLSILPDLFPIRVIEEEKTMAANKKQAKPRWRRTRSRRSRASSRKANRRGIGSTGESPGRLSPRELRLVATMAELSFPGAV